MEKSLAEYPHHNTCFSCHHQGVPSLAFSLARSHGFADAGGTLSRIARHTAADLKQDIEAYRKGAGQPGGVTRAGYALFALQQAGAPHDEVTSAVAGFLLQRDKDLGYWRAGSHRPPAEQSDFTNTFLGIRCLNAFGERTDKIAIDDRIGRALHWLETTPPKDTEDRVFRLWGLKEAGSHSETIAKAANDLVALQRADGGWAQLPDAASDAYATGSVLSVLLLTGSLSPSDVACRRGVQFLLTTQEPDGSWHVVTRSKPVQPYFESGFPHGRDQFISMTATAWATSALILSGPSTSVAAR